MVFENVTYWNYKYSTQALIQPVHLSFLCYQKYTKHIKITNFQTHEENQILSILNVHFG